MRSLLTGLLLGFTVLSNQVALAKIYTWTDENGKRHYADTPPSDAKDLRETTVNISSYSFGSSTPKKSENTSILEDGTLLSGLPEKDPNECERAREYLRFMTESPRVGIKGQDGKYTYLNPDQRQTEKDKAQQSIDMYC